MEKELGQEYKNPIQREAFLKDNCDACEQKGYMKPYSPEELQGHKERHTNLSIEIDKIEDEKKVAMETFKGQLKPLREECKQLLKNIKAKAEYVTEMCYRFTDQETKETGYYNKDGKLIESRPATVEELTRNLAAFDPQDPCKYDFALFGIGESQKHVKR